MNESSPPLKVWFYTFGIVLLLLSVSAVDKTKSSELQKLIKNAIIKNKKNPIQNTSILFLGSSLTGHALYNQTLIKDKFMTRGNGKTNILVLAIIDLHYARVEDLHIFEHIIESPPDYLFIENNHINIDDINPNEKLNLLKSSVSNLISWPKKIIGIQEIGTIHFFKKILNSPSHLNYFDARVYSKLLKKKRLVRTFDQNKEANDAYAALLKKNTKIVFLDLPRTQELEKISLNSNQKKELQTLLDIYYQKYGIAYWKYPYSLSNNDFIDGGHLNCKGAKKYQDWLIAQFKLLP